MQNPEISNDGIVVTRIQDGTHNAGVLSALASKVYGTLKFHIPWLASVWKKFRTDNIDKDSKDYKKHAHEAKNVGQRFNRIIRASDLRNLACESNTVAVMVVMASGSRKQGAATVSWGKLASLEQFEAWDSAIF
ncbi:hypothetical protein DMENIID0001_155570 [Sergentomyia squamirostris]